MNVDTSFAPMQLAAYTGKGIQHAYLDDMFFHNDIGQGLYWIRREEYVIYRIYTFDEQYCCGHISVGNMPKMFKVLENNKLYRLIRDDE